MKNTIIKALKLLLTIFISIIFCYFVFRGVDLRKTYEFVLNAKLIYIFAAFLTVLVAQVLRSLRWGVMLHPIEPLSQRLLLPISSIGYMFIVLLPARLGELVRPYLLHQNSKVNVSTAMATVVLERILDLLFIFVFFGVIAGTVDLPHWVKHGVVYFLIVTIIIIGLLFLGKLKWVNHKFNLLTHKIFPKKFALYAQKMMERFYEGMHVIGRGRHALVIVLITASIWGFFILFNLILFKAFQIQLGPFAALAVLTLTALGISIPAGPGFIGNFHFFCVMALSIFGIGKEMALSYALVNHLIFFGTFTLLGVISLNISGLNLGLKFLRPSSLLNRGKDFAS